jgi:hypothetical protein
MNEPRTMLERQAEAMAVDATMTNLETGVEFGYLNG